MNREQRNNLINTCLQEIRRLQEENQQLKEQLQQKEDIINKAKEYIKLKLNMKNKDGFPFLLFKRTHVEKILEILDNKGEDKNE